MIVTIHQPNFFPWYPFFAKMESADVFVILRHCQFEKNNFQNRFQYNDAWMTMSTNKGLDPIVEKRYVNPKADWEKIKAKIPSKKNILSKFDDCISDSLYETNYEIIKRATEFLNIKTKIILDEPTELRSTARLVDICKKLGAKKYISGTGGKNYLDLSLFNDANIEVEFQNLKSEDKIHTLDKLI